MEKSDLPSTDIISRLLCNSRFARLDEENPAVAGAHVCFSEELTFKLPSACSTESNPVHGLNILFIKCHLVCSWVLVFLTHLSQCACLLNFALLFFQSQQPLEDLDAQLRRALSPETVPVSTHTQVIAHFWHSYRQLLLHDII